MKPLLIIGSIFYLGPIIGLLGTVIGMIQTFKAITIYGTGDPEALSQGISTALVTTEIGLVFGIIGLLLLIVCHIQKFKHEPASESSPDSDKSYAVCLLLNLFLGGIGAHHFYAGRTAVGIIYVFTLGGLIVGQYIDFINLAWGKFNDSDGRRIRYISNQFRADVTTQPQ